MAQPTPYERQSDLTAYAQNHPSAPYNAALVDAEFDAVMESLNETITNLGIIQRDDGQLQNGIVTPDSLNNATLNLIGEWTPRGPWLPDQLYAVRDMVTILADNSSYVCATTHTSSSFAIDLAAGYWQAVNRGNDEPATFTDLVVDSILVNDFTPSAMVYSDVSRQLVSTAAPTNGQILIGSTGAVPVLGTIGGTANQVTVTNAAGTITLSLPQNIAAASTPTFAALALSGMTAGSIIFSGAAGALSQDNANLFWDNAANELIVKGNIGFGASPTVVPAIGNPVVGANNLVLYNAGDLALSLLTDNAVARTQQIGFGAAGINAFDAGIKWATNTRRLEFWHQNVARLRLNTAGFGVNRIATVVPFEVEGAAAFYRTFTDTSNYERLDLQSGAGYFELAVGTAGTGTNDIDIRLTPAGTGQVVLSAPLSVASGGTGRATSTTAYGLLAAGTTATGAHQTLAAGATTEILVGGGAAALPVWTTATGTGGPVRAGSPSITTPTVVTSITLNRTGGEAALILQESGTSRAQIRCITSPSDGVRITDGTAATEWARWESSGMTVAAGVKASYFATSIPVTETGATHTVAATTAHLICDRAGTVTVTLPSAASFPGRQLTIKTIQAQQVDSNASNVVPRAGGAAGTVILPNTDGAWTLLVSDGTNWIAMAGNA